MIRCKRILIDKKNAYDNGSWNQAAFMLHQSTKHLYDCLILVYIDYKPKTHNLEKFERQACRSDCLFKIIFHRTTPYQFVWRGRLPRSFVKSSQNIR
jgi:uncharacterized protein